MTFRKRIDRLLETLLVVLMGAMVLNVLWQVFTRFVISSPSSYTEEIARYLLIWVGLLGAAYATGQGSHLAVDILPTRLKGRARFRLQLLLKALVASFAFAVLVVGGAQLVRLTLSLGQTSAALHIPLGYVYLVLPVSGLIIVFFVLDQARDDLRLLRQVDLEEAP